MNAKKFGSLLLSLDACADAREFCKGKTLMQSWRTSKRGDWMLWLIGKMSNKPGWPTRKQVVLAACDCAELALKFVPKGEYRPKQAIETARKWVRGIAASEAVGKAADAAAYAARDADASAAAAYASAAEAYASAAAAYAANAAAANAARAAICAARTAYAADASANAAVCAARAAYAADDADDAAVLAECAVLVRKQIKLKAQ